MDLSGNVSGLNPEFLSRLTDLSNDPAIRHLIITDGARTYAQQAALARRKGIFGHGGLAAPPGTSLHERGIAADVEGNLSLADKLAPKYGLTSGVNWSTPEPWHFQPAEGRGLLGERGTVSRAPIIPSPPINPTINPNAFSGLAPQALLSGANHPANVPNPLDRQPRPMNDPDVIAAGLSPRLSGYSLPGLSAAMGVQQATMAPTETQASLDLKRRVSSAEDYIRRMQGMAVPQEEMATAPPPILRKTEPIPDRGQVHPNRAARIAAALLSIAAPEAAGQFMGSVFGGETQARDTGYQDALTRYRMATQTDDQQFQDAAAQRAEQMRLQDVNQQRVFGNLERQYGANVDQARVGADLTGDRQEVGAVDAMLGQQKKVDILGARKQGIDKQITEGLAQEKTQMAADLKDAQMREAQWRTMFTQDQQNKRLGTTIDARLDMPGVAPPGSEFYDRRTGQMTGQTPYRPMPQPEGTAIVRPNAQGGVDTLAQARPRTSAPPRTASPIHDKIERVTLWRKLHDMEIKAADKEYGETETNHRKFSTDASLANRSATAAEEKWNTFDRAHPWSERKGDQDLYDLGVALHNQAVAARGHANRLQATADELKKQRDSAKAKLDAAATPPANFMADPVGNKALTDTVRASLLKRAGWSGAGSPTAAQKEKAKALAAAEGYK